MSGVDVDQSEAAGKAALQASQELGDFIEGWLVKNADCGLPTLACINMAQAILAYQTVFASIPEGDRKKQALSVLTRAYHALMAGDEQKSRELFFDAGEIAATTVTGYNKTPERWFVL